MIQTDTYLSQSDEQREAPSEQFIRTSLKQGGLKISLSNQYSSELLKFCSRVIFSRCLLLLASPPLLKCIDQDLHQFEDILHMYSFSGISLFKIHIRMNRLSLIEECGLHQLLCGQYRYGKSSD